MPLALSKPPENLTLSQNVPIPDHLYHILAIFLMILGVEEVPCWRFAAVKGGNNVVDEGHRMRVPSTADRTLPPHNLD